MPLSREELIKIQAELEAEIRKIKPFSYGGGVSRPEYLEFGAVIRTIRQFFESEPTMLTIAQVKAMIENKIKRFQKDSTCTPDELEKAYAIKYILRQLLKEIEGAECDDKRL